MDKAMSTFVNNGYSPGRVTCPSCGSHGRIMFKETINHKAHPNFVWKCYGESDTFLLPKDVHFSVCPFCDGTPEDVFVKICVICRGRGWVRI